MVSLIIVSVMSVLLNTDHDSFVGCLTRAKAFSYTNFSGRATKPVGDSNKNAVFSPCTQRWWVATINIHLENYIL